MKYSILDFKNRAEYGILEKEKIEIYEKPEKVLYSNKAKKLAKEQKIEIKKEKETKKEIEIKEEIEIKKENKKEAKKEIETKKENKKEAKKEKIKIYEEEFKIENDYKTKELVNDMQGISERELKLMKKSYSEINSILYPLVVEVIDEYEYIGSPIYSPIGVDRETIAQMIDRVIDLGTEKFDYIGEIKNTKGEGSPREWDRWRLLRATVESIILNEIFAIRRPSYFKKYAPQTFK